MKTIIAGTLFMCAFAGACVSSVAQITITAADVNATLAVGNSIVTMTDTLTTLANIGSPGATSWDFSGLLNHTSITLTSVTPSSTPFIAQFPGATHTLKTSLAGSFSGIPGTVAGDLYTYVTLGANLVNTGGMGSGTITLPGANPLPGQLSMINTPPDTTYALPSSIGTLWGSTYTTTTVITVAGFELSRTLKNYRISYAVDAYGPMKMPGGSVHQALRIRKVDRGDSPNVGYIFLAKEGATVQVTAGDTSLPDSGTITIARRYVTWASGLPTSVQNSDVVPAEFSLAQNYPNPFNPTTTIRYGLPSRSAVQLRVFNILGQQVASLVSGDQDAGYHEVRFDGSGLASGMYFYRIQAEKFVETKTLLLIR